MTNERFALDTNETKKGTFTAPFLKVFYSLLKIK